VLKVLVLRVPKVLKVLVLTVPKVLKVLKVRCRAPLLPSIDPIAHNRAKWRHR